MVSNMRLARIRNQDYYDMGFKVGKPAEAPIALKLEAAKGPGEHSRCHSILSRNVPGLAGHDGFVHPKQLVDQWLRFSHPNETRSRASGRSTASLAEKIDQSLQART